MRALANTTRLLTLSLSALGCSPERTDPEAWMQALERGEALSCDGGSRALVTDETLHMTTELSGAMLTALVLALVVASLSLAVFGVYSIRAAHRGRDSRTSCGRASAAALGVVALCVAVWLPQTAWSRGLGTTRVEVAAAGHVVAQVGRPGRRVQGPGHSVGLVYSLNKGGRVHALRVSVGDEDVTALRCGEGSEEALLALREWLASRYSWRTEDTRWVFTAL